MSGLVEFQVAYQISPVILTGGLAQNVPGGMIPIISLTQAQDYDLGLLSSSSNIDPDDFFASFTPMPGSTLVENAVATYPFANARVAANAIVTQPLRISLLMQVPVRKPGGYADKQQVMTSLKSSLDQHNLAGGTYTVATPSYTYVNCLLTALRDVGGAESKQAQIVWQMDFMQPLLTAADAQAAQNSLMTKISNGTAVSGDPPSFSGPEPSIGQPPSGTAPRAVPAARMPAGTAVAGAAGLPPP